ncbi:MAG: invasion associated locus B family protein [Alphaproteobacteria bacterium]|nr:invasion associated locus B family protein [Alphaproteobacteria bacterium]
MAQDAKTIATHGDWTAYVFKENKKQVCFMASRPTKSEGTYKQRGDVLASITHRPGEGAFGVFSFVAGYPLKEGRPVKIDIGTRPFTLGVSHGETAWASSDDDKNLVHAMKGAKTMTVLATSAKGTESKDYFSLNGFDVIYEAINKA